MSPDGNPSFLRAEGFKEALSEFGELTLLSGGDRMSERQIADHVRRCHVYLAGHGTTPLPKCLAEDRGSLEYICGITGTMRPFVPVELVDPGIPLTNWGDAPANGVAEGAMALLLLPSRTCTTTSR
jgi:phosphoglycerate dehydrogenase-like enzyme